MFQGPKGYIAQICEVHLQYGNSTTKWPFYTFFSKFHSNIYSILFDCNQPQKSRNDWHGYNVNYFNLLQEHIQSRLNSSVSGSFRFTIGPTKHYFSSSLSYSIKKDNYVILCRLMNYWPRFHWIRFKNNPYSKSASKLFHIS